MKKVFGCLSLLVIAAAALIAFSLPGVGQVVQPGGKFSSVSSSLTGLQATVAGTSVVSPTNATFQISAPGDVASYVTVTPASSSTGVLYYNYVFSPDGVTYGTEVHPHVVTLNGTATVVAYTNFMRAAGFGNAAFVKLTSISNTSSVVITNNNVTVFSFLN